MNKPVMRLMLACCLMAALLTGCAFSSPPIAYYSLYAPAQQPAATIAPADSTLAVSIGPVTIPDILKQTQIATGGAEGRYRLAEYHRWSGELDRDFARAVAEQLAGMLGTQQVALFPWDQQFHPTCRVVIDVLSMGGEPGQEASLAARWSLVDPQGQRPLVVRRSELRAIPATTGYQGWVTAQQHNIASLSAEIATAIKTAFKP